MSRSQFSVALMCLFSEDIDECDLVTDNCNTTSMNCENNAGAFRCACKNGYTGNGSTCTGWFAVLYSIIQFFKSRPRVGGACMVPIYEILDN